VTPQQHPRLWVLCRIILKKERRTPNAKHSAGAKEDVKKDLVWIQMLNQTHPNKKAVRVKLPTMSKEGRGSREVQSQPVPAEAGQKASAVLAAVDVAVRISDPMALSQAQSCATTRACLHTATTTRTSGNDMSDMLRRIRVLNFCCACEEAASSCQRPP